MLFRSSARSGDTDAFLRIAEIYEKGQLGQPDYGRALEWYEAAVQKIKDTETRAEIYKKIGGWCVQGQGVTGHRQRGL